MKRILAFLLCLLTLVTAAACGKTDPAVTAEPGESSATASDAPKTNKPIADPWKSDVSETEPATESGLLNLLENQATAVEDKSTKQKLAAIPIAKNGMSSDELRQIVVDFMRLSLEFPWTPNETWNNDDLHIVRQKGYVYGGVPYISTGSGNIYRMMEVYDEATGTINVTNYQSAASSLANACSGGAGWAWQRVINSADISWSWSLTQNNGCLRIGPYTYSDERQNFNEALYKGDDRFTAKEVVLANGEQMMYESYAAALPGDGLTHPGHVRMVSIAPVVVRNADGTINGKESYLCYCDQVLYVTELHHRRTQSDGTVYNAQGGVDVKISFADLYKTYYIPFTFKEFHGLDPVEDGSATLGLTGASVTTDDLKKATLTANYAISDVFITVTSPTGEQLFRLPRRAGNFFTFAIVMEKSVMVSSVVQALKKYADGQNTISVTVQIANGEIVTAYSGTLAQ